MSITENLKLRNRDKNPLDAGGVKELCDGYAEALQVTDTSKYMNKVWTKLPSLFIYVENLIVSRNEMREAQHTTFAENEQLRKDATTTQQSAVLVKDRKIAELEESLKRETALVIQAKRQFEEQLKKANTLIDECSDKDAEIAKLNAANFQIGQEAYGLKTALDEACSIQGALKAEPALIHKDDDRVKISNLKDIIRKQQELAYSYQRALGC